MKRNLHLISLWQENDILNKTNMFFQIFYICLFSYQLI